MGRGLFNLSSQLKKLGLLLHAAWLLIIVGSIWINHLYSQREMEQTALVQAQAVFKRDMAFRRWFAEVGGVYVPTSAGIPPNPYLAHLPDRDQSKNDGTPLTLINPAYLIRLVNESAAGKEEPASHMTSLNPLRPENHPDLWERQALQRIEQGAEEVAEFTTLNGAPVLRYLHIAKAQKPCLKCHASQGYQEGDIRGGLAVVLPLGALQTLHEKTVLAMFGWHLLVYLLGATLLGKGLQLLTHRVRERDLAIAALEESEANFRTVADFAYAWEYWLGPDGEMRYISPSVKELTGYGPERFLTDNNFLPSIVEEDDREALCNHLAEKQQSKCAFDFRIRTASGEIRWLHHICRPVYDRHGVFLGRRASNYDISEEKGAKLRNEALIGKLREALDRVKTLSGFLPICASCKKIRDDRGYWSQIESYISQHSEAVFSHGICPDCARRLYPGLLSPENDSGDNPSPGGAERTGDD